MKKILFIITLIALFFVFGTANTYAASATYISLEGPAEVSAGQTYTYSYYIKSTGRSGPTPDSNSLSLDSSRPITTFSYDANIFDIISGDTKSNYGIVVDSDRQIVPDETKVITISVYEPLISITLKVKDDVASQTTNIGSPDQPLDQLPHSIITNIKVTGADTNVIETNMPTTNEIDNKSNTTSDTLMTVAIIALGVVVVAICVTLVVVVNRRK